MKTSLLAIAFAVATSMAFAQTAPAQNPPAATGSTAQTGSTTTKTNKKPKVKKHTKKPATNNTTTGTDAGKTGK